MAPGQRPAPARRSTEHQLTGPMPPCAPSRRVLRLYSGPRPAQVRQPGSGPSATRASIPHAGSPGRVHPSCRRGERGEGEHRPDHDRHDGRDRAALPAPPSASAPRDLAGAAGEPKASIAPTTIELARRPPWRPVRERTARAAGRRSHTTERSTSPHQSEGPLALRLIIRGRVILGRAVRLGCL
jgi:hypothetical protein